MKIYVWEGDGISSAYHDNGTLVVLAESPEQARELVRRQAQEIAQTVVDWTERVEKFARDNGYAWGNRVRGGKPGLWQAPGIHEATDPYYLDSGFDGTDRALDREPDRVIDLDQPVVVAFNGGGYD